MPSRLAVVVRHFLQIKDQSCLLLLHVEGNGYNMKIQL
jgi:hypothetical protein